MTHEWRCGASDRHITVDLRRSAQVNSAFNSHGFFQQAISKRFCRKPGFRLAPGAIEQITFTVSFQVAYAIPFAQGIENIGVVGVTVEFNVLYAGKAAYQRFDGAEMGQEIIHVRWLEFHSDDSYDHGGLG